jgi:hypothetical protein
MVPAVAVKVAVDDPGATDTAAGVVNDAVLLESATVPPPVFDNVTVQFADAPEANEVGVQLTALMIVGTRAVIVPPVVVNVPAVPSGIAAIPSISPMAVDVTPLAILTFTVATAPFAMMFVFWPTSTQEYVVDPLTHERDFPAATAAGPAVALMEMTCCGE